MSDLKVFYDLDKWSLHRKELGQNPIGFVPTMGALHAGHLSLIKKSKQNNDLTIASIYVNPTQFNNENDLATYPNTIEKDLDLLERLEVDCVLLPNYSQMYPDNFKFRVLESDFSQRLCGKHRPGHFDGVLTVVMKLLNLTQPTNAYFGLKDYQQFKLVQGMCEAFFMNVNIVGCETLREKDGLAMSSRNTRLDSDGRLKAKLFANLLSSSNNPLIIRDRLTEAGVEVDYIEEYMGRRFGAANIGSVRLIDNVEL